MPNVVAGPAHIFPLAEVFGFDADDTSPEAARARETRYCPFIDDKCSKGRKNDPLGVCSIWDRNKIVVTCPNRFRGEGQFEDDVKERFFNDAVRVLPEADLVDTNVAPIGSIDFVFQSESDREQFISVEVQSVYTSGGNVQKCFDFYVKCVGEGRLTYATREAGWPNGVPHADFLSSQKRLTAQLMAKGNVLTRGWKKIQIVVIDKPYWDAMPAMIEVKREAAEIVWLVYMVEEKGSPHRARLYAEHYTTINAMTDAVLNPAAGDMGEFLDALDRKAAALAKRQKKLAVAR